MNDEELRKLLARVKGGELSPEDAAAQLSGAEGEGDTPHDAEQTVPDTSEPPRESDFRNVRHVRIRATANRTRVVGDPAVRTVKVSGPHRLEVDDDQVIVENEIVDDIFGDTGGYVRIGGMRAGRGRGGPRIHGMGGRGFGGGQILEVRVNPEMALDFDCDAGMIEVLGVTGPLSGRVNAGNAVIEDFEGPIDLSVNAGKLRARGRLVGGSSKIDVNVGKADVLLEAGSNVRIVRSATFGSAESDDDTFGTGEGTLRVTCSLGAVRVHSPGSSFEAKHRAC